MLKPDITRSAAVLVFATLVAAAGRAQTVAEQSPEIQARVDSVFAEYDHTASPGCALGVVHDGQLVYARGYGMANLDLGIAITPGSVFRIASTSKQFTAASTVLLAQSGAISLDDDIREYLPEIPEYERPVTIRQLLNHTSGIRDYLALMRLAGLRGQDWYTDEEALAMIVRQTNTNFEPGSEHLYSNSGYFLISQIVKRVSGMSLREYAQENIFTPLGMTDTHFHDDHNEVVPNRASGYEPAPDGGFRISMTTLDMIGDGGVFTTVEDLARWDRNFYQPVVGGAEFLETMLQRGVLTDGDTLDYALGLRHQVYRGVKSVRHGGAFVGYRAEMIRLPEQRFTVICLCNVGTANPSRLVDRVADIYLADVLEPQEEVVAEHAEPTATVTEVELSAAQLARWAGLYRQTESGNYLRIEMRAGKLVALIGPGFELLPMAEDRFQLSVAPVEFRFASAANNTMRLTVIQSGSENSYESVEPAVLTDADRNAYMGTYYCDELGVDYRVSVVKGELTVKRGRADPITLRPTIEDEFTLAGDRVMFERDSDGRPQAFVLNAGRVRGLRFVRVGES